MIGFRADGGEVLVDGATLRQIRFPSINHLHYEPFYDVDPVILKNALFEGDYNPFEGIRHDVSNIVSVPPYKSGGKPLVDPQFLQNGRINDMSSMWYEQPYTRTDPHNLPVSMTFEEPRWVSMVVMYFNYYDEENVTPHFDIYVTDVDREEEVKVASVRNNRRLFTISKFEPVRASQVRLELVNSIRRLRTVTEVELYGPLSGREISTGPADAGAHYTYMGSFARVDKRPKQLAEPYDVPHQSRRPHDRSVVWYAPNAQVMASEGKMFMTRALGINDTYELGGAPERIARARAGGLGYTPYVTYKGGLLLKCGHHGKLYCIDGASGRELWSVRLGERLVGAPVVHQEDVFVAGDTGKLYKLDLANGSVMMDAELPGASLASMASDGRRLFVITDDGTLNCYGRDGLRQIWSEPVAPYTDSTPAVDAGVVYLADQQGRARAVRAKTGETVWTAELAQEFTRCPVVTERYVLFGCRQGRLVALSRAEGREVWAKQTNSRFQYEPMVLGEEALYFDGTAARLARLSDGRDRPFRTWSNPRHEEPGMRDFHLPDDPLAPLSYYRKRIFVVTRAGDSGHTDMYTNHAWHLLGGKYFMLSPKTEKEE
jgi:hypothetical protein